MRGYLLELREEDVEDIFLQELINLKELYINSNHPEHGWLKTPDNYEEMVKAFRLILEYCGG